MMTRAYSIFLNYILILIIFSFVNCSRSERHYYDRYQTKPSSSKQVPLEDTVSSRTRVPESNRTSPAPAQAPAQGASGEASSLPDLFQEAQPAVFTIYARSGEGIAQGSGFFISANGIGISNYHVFEGVWVNNVTIKLQDGTESRISEILVRNSEEDYIIFKATSRYSNFPYLPVASREPEIGVEVFAIGTPLGLEQTLSTGIVSAYRDNNKLIQTTAEIARGSSGGPLLNMRGEVIGITTATMGEANLNFAINISLLNLGRF